MKNLYLLASYPKSGNTWVRIFLTNLQNKAPYPVSINELPGETASDRILFNQMVGIQADDLREVEILNLRQDALDIYLKNHQHPCIFKIHDILFPRSTQKAIVPIHKIAGVIYIIRNPLDVCVSYSAHLNIKLDQTIRYMNNPNATVNLTKKGAMSTSVNLEQPLGTWSEHVLSWCSNAHFPILIVRYEDLTHDPKVQFLNIANFLNLKASQEELAAAIENSKFSQVQTQEREFGFREKPPRMSQFFRKGVIGSWHEELTEAQAEQIITTHRGVMKKFGYLDKNDRPVF